MRNLAYKEPLRTTEHVVIRFMISVLRDSPAISLTRCHDDLRAEGIERARARMPCLPDTNDRPYNKAEQYYGRTVQPNGVG